MEILELLAGPTVTSTQCSSLSSYRCLPPWLTFIMIRIIVRFPPLTDHKLLGQLWARNPPRASPWHTALTRDDVALKNFWQVFLPSAPGGEGRYRARDEAPALKRWLKSCWRSGRDKASGLVSFLLWTVHHACAGSGWRSRDWSRTHEPLTKQTHSWAFKNLNYR